MVTAAAKSKGWEEVAEKVSSVSGIKRTGIEVQKKWMGLKSGAKEAAVSSKKNICATGGGSVVGPDVDDSSKRILGVIGSVCVDGVFGGVDTAATELGLSGNSGKFYFLYDYFFDYSASCVLLTRS